MKKITRQIGKAVASAALVVTKFNANSTCIFNIHQPVMPEKSKKLRKF